MRRAFLLLLAALCAGVAQARVPDGWPFLEYNEAVRVAKQSNKPLFVFDQDKNGWFMWDGEHDTWIRRDGADAPVITHTHITGTGTRFLKANGEQAITELFQRSF